MTREHEYMPVTADGKRWCKHCGSMLHTRILQTCIERVSPGGLLMPEPARRSWAYEDFDAIGARLIELRKEREAVEATAAPAPAEQSADTVDDLLCG